MPVKRIYNRIVTNLPYVVAIVVLFFTLLPSLSLATQSNKSDYQLSISFDIETHTLIATAKIIIKQDEKLTLTLSGLNITGTLLKEEGGGEFALRPTGNLLSLQPSEKARVLFVSYTKTIENSFNNSINRQGISLLNGWYPLPHTPMRYRVSASLPKNFSAITESDTFPLTQNTNTVLSTFSRPVTQIHFIAGPYVIQKQQVRPDLFVYSMFFEEDKELATGYLEAATQYLNRYEQEIGPYPFHHYVIVANRAPTGFGMPTFTLLGQMVLRLPFIKNSSLGHEIVHSWFGNAVDVDYSQGNWCEGLTTFLADSAFREERGEGSANRKESITRYLSYVHEKSAIPLAEFSSASHQQPMAEAKRAVGYNRGALFFYELKDKIGHKFFIEGLRLFYAKYNGVDASWEDLRKSFETPAQTDLTDFFSQRLTRTYIPELAVENAVFSSVNNQPVLSFSLLQKSEKPFSLKIPVSVKTTTGTKTFTIEASELLTPVNIPLDSKPLEFTIDPGYDFLRTLTVEESPPVWSRFLGAEKKLIILGSEDKRSIYAPLINTFDEAEIVVTTSDMVTNQQLGEYSLLFLGTDQSACRSLFGQPDLPETEIRLDVRRNPINRNHVAVLFFSKNKEATEKVASRLRHYGKYSLLEFHDGRNVIKKIHPTESGLRIIMEELPTGGSTTDLASFQQILTELAQSTVIYIGENHTSLADHLLQFRIIEGLFKRDPRLAIGMEMFPVSSQAALDRYTLHDGAVNEATFLKESDYFNVWRYDYRFFRNILNFARANHIPVIGLNLDRKIVSRVFRTGSTDTLEKEVRDTLPQDRNLDLKGYTRRLSAVHEIHIRDNHASGAESGFIQAQGLWDETMAQNIVNYLSKNKDHKMVVLAGSQHTRKDSGIPPRVQQRLAIKQTSVLNIYTDFAPANLATVADYYFLATPVDLPEIPKIGIVLTTNSEVDNHSLTISQITPHGKAKDAGLLTGDILTAVDDFPVSTMADLRIAMLDTRPGESIAVRVVRNDNGTDKEMVFKVELTLTPVSPPHP